MAEHAEKELFKKQAEVKEKMSQAIESYNQLLNKHWRSNFIFYLFLNDLDLIFLDLLLDFLSPLFQEVMVQSQPLPLLRGQFSSSFFYLNDQLSLPADIFSFIDGLQVKLIVEVFDPITRASDLLIE